MTQQEGINTGTLLILNGGRMNDNTDQEETTKETTTQNHNNCDKKTYYPSKKDKQSKVIYRNLSQEDIDYLVDFNLLEREGYMSKYFNTNPIVIKLTDQQKITLKDQLYKERQGRRNDLLCRKDTVRQINEDRD